MPEPDYEALAYRADSILVDLMLSNGVGLDQNSTGADVKALQSALNARLHAEFREFSSGGVRIAGATPVPSRGVFMSILLEMIDHGIKEGMWTVEYDGAGHLRRLEQGYLHGKPKDERGSGQTDC